MSEIILFVVIVFGGLLLWLATGRERPARYRKKRLLTGGEREFFERLRQALPECRVCPQVAVSALIEPAGSGPVRKAALGNISGQKVGFAVFDEQMDLLAVVELEHRSRTSRKALARDACFANAGIRTIRFKARRLPSEAKIRGSVFSRGALPRRAVRATADIEYVRPENPWRNTANARS